MSSFLHLASSHYTSYLTIEHCLPSSASGCRGEIVTNNEHEYDLLSIQPNSILQQHHDHGSSAPTSITMSSEAQPVRVHSMMIKL